MTNKKTDEIDKMSLREKIEFITGEKDSPFCDMAESMASEYQKQYKEPENDRD